MDLGDCEVENKGARKFVAAKIEAKVHIPRVNLGVNALILNSFLLGGVARLVSPIDSTPADELRKR
jgi:hypothetical protein